jgi:hypothetical protein
MPTVRVIQIETETETVCEIHQSTACVLMPILAVPKIEISIWNVRMRHALMIC